MEHFQSTATTANDDNDHFFDALDDFPFYDCVDTIEPNSGPTSHPEAAAAASSLERKPSPEIPQPSGLQRRRSWSQHVRNDAAGNDSKNSNHNSTVSRHSTSRVERKYRVSRSLKENERAGERPDSIRSVDEKTKERPDSSRSVNEETKENSTVTTVDDDRVDEPAGVESASGGANERSFTFLFVLAGLLIKAIAFQTSLLVNFVTFPIWLLYCGYTFVIDPFRAVRHAREYGMARVLRMWGIIGDTVTPFVYEWLKEHKSVWRMALRFGWGFLWASYVCVVLITLLVSAFVVSGFMVRHLVEEPIQRKETLTFDYTKNSPVAHVRLISCPGEPRGVTNTENIGLENVGAPRVIPPKHKLQVTVALTLPESDYNRNLGIFQAYFGHKLWTIRTSLNRPLSQSGQLLFDQKMNHIDIKQRRKKRFLMQDFMTRTGV
ncbi:seipin-2 isoform X2 [Rhododendron vialii]|uniref:seipin-2 isoform X2 n=1 Tax=Rhododendron vialii TaxID=182163 RepID=UPI00265E802B|nr:seipin-2 isoform X2 [Rhododendron vialii]